MRNLIKKIVKPESDVETLITNDSDFIAGAGHGKPRRGHPEGQIIYHIGEVLGNVEKHHTVDDRLDLRLITIIHDTFKYKVNGNLPKRGENHHGMIARRFAEKFISENHLLTIIELHDEAYNAWQIGGRRGNWDKAEVRANHLIKRLIIENCLELYIKFLHCDGETGDKDCGVYEWFVDLTNKYVN